MKSVLTVIANDGWSEIDNREERQALINILSISSKPLREAFGGDFSYEEIKSVRSWIEDNRDTDPSLTSQIESKVYSKIK